MIRVARLKCASSAIKVRGNPLSSITFMPRETVKLRVPLRPENDVCTVRFRISPTAVPGGGDLRELGARFLAFEYERP